MGISNRAVDILALMGEISGNQGNIEDSLKWFDQSIPLASTVEERTAISHRLTNILKLSMQNSRRDIAEYYILRLKDLGAQVTIKGA